MLRPNTIAALVLLVVSAGAACQSGCSSTSRYLLNIPYRELPTQTANAEGCPIRILEVHSAEVEGDTPHGDLWKTSILLRNDSASAAVRCTLILRLYGTRDSEIARAKHDVLVTIAPGQMYEELHTERLSDDVWRKRARRTGVVVAAVGLADGSTWSLGSVSSMPDK